MPYLLYVISEYYSNTNEIDFKHEKVKKFLIQVAKVKWQVDACRV